MSGKISSGAKEALRAQGKRLTAQRVLILKVLEDSCKHLDADEIYRLAREEDPRISLSTVYRTLNTLKELGFIIELHFNEGHHHYEIKNKKEHHHLICSSCGRILEFESFLVEQLKREVAQKKDFEIHQAHIDLYGLCPNCRALT